MTTTPVGQVGGVFPTEKNKNHLFRVKRDSFRNNNKKERFLGKTLLELGQIFTNLWKVVACHFLDP